MPRSHGHGTPSAQGAHNGDRTPRSHGHRTGKAQDKHGRAQEPMSYEHRTCNTQGEHTGEKRQRGNGQRKRKAPGAYTNERAPRSHRHCLHNAQCVHSSEQAPRSHRLYMYTHVQGQGTGYNKPQPTRQTNWGDAPQMARTPFDQRHAAKNVAPKRGICTRNIFLWNIYLDRLEIIRVPEYKNLID